MLQVSECIMARTPLCFVRRDHFLEEPYLRRLLAESGGAIEIPRSDFVHGRWGPYLSQALQATMSYEYGLKTPRRSTVGMTATRYIMRCTDVGLVLLLA